MTNPHLFPQPLFWTYQILRFLFIIVSVFLAGMLIFLLARNQYVKNRYLKDWSEFVESKPYGKAKIVKEWDRIIKQMREGGDSEKKLAIIEADDMVNEMLEKMGYKDEKLEAKLESVNKNIIPNVEDLKKIHKRKRDIVYDPGYIISEEEAEEIMSVYEKTFKDIQFL